jgi:SecD/SecF fusion protein
MKSNRSVVVFSIVLAIACLYQLSFTFKARSFENDAHAFAAKKAKSGEREKDVYLRYIDSLGNKPCYNLLGIADYTYFECKQKEINLGLDLRGGMNVTLEVEKDAIVKVLANDPKDADLLKAVKMADIAVRDKGTDYVDAFISAFNEVAPGRNMAVLFVKGNNSVIQPNSSQTEVVNYLRSSINTAVANVKSVVEKRINQANVTQPVVQIVEGGRISVELPGVDNPRRMEDLVEKSAKLEFYEVNGGIDGVKIYSQLMKAASMASAPIKDTASNDTSMVKDSSLAKTADAGKSEKSILSSILKPFGKGEESAVCTIKGSNREKLLKILSEEKYAAILEPSVKIAFSAKPQDYDQSGKELTNSEDYFVYFLKRDRDGNAALSSEEENIISDARENTNQTGQLEVSMEMTPSAASRWAQVTGANIGKYIAIVLDDRVYSAPRVNGKISGGSSQISGNFDIREAQDLANVLKAGKLPAPARIVASEVVGASLGDAAISKGFLALILGFISVVLFMVVYYNRAGWISIVAVLGNVFLIMGVLSSLGAALTLPGMAGIILTIGMAVDANVLIYERIKDELALGKGMKTAINEGFKHAMSAIIDSNITHLLAGFILTFTGAGPVYGFAIILVIGIFSSLFTALFITRLLLDRRADKGLDTKFGFTWNENFLKNKNIDWVKNRKKYYLFSSVVIVLGIVSFITKGGITTGIDFKGGNSFIIQFDGSKNYKTEDIKEILDKSLAGSSNEVKTFGSEGQYKILTTYLLKESSSKETKMKVQEDLLKALSSFELKKDKNGDGPVVQVSNVTPTIATEIRNKSAFLVMLTVVGIFLFLVFRFRSIAYGIGAAISLVHDLALVLSVYAIVDGFVPFSTEFDQHLIAALLTILGYSINDTVIVFDRIREFLTSRRTDKDDTLMINSALNDTLSRTIITSSTVFVVCIILFLFGGDALKNFSFAMLIGVVIGTYSSLCIATPIVIDLTSKKKSKN